MNLIQDLETVIKFLSFKSFRLLCKIVRETDGNLFFKFFVCIDRSESRKYSNISLSKSERFWMLKNEISVTKFNNSLCNLGGATII